MKIGNINIEHAYFGNLELNNDNAFIGIYPVIEKPTELCFKSLQDNSTIGMSHHGTNATTSIPQLEYSRDQKEWTPWFFETLTVNNGEKVYFRGNNEGISKSSDNYSSFTGTGKFNLSGDILSIIDKEDFKNLNTISYPYCFYKLFSSNSSLYDVHKIILKAETLSDSCYRNLFALSGNISISPKLPALNLAKDCYTYMFYNTNLKSCPELPATNIAESCYNHMFYNCKGLTSTLNELPATILKTGCYTSMFENCSNIKTSPNLPATTTVKSCYARMFTGCTKLIEAPDLLSDSAAAYCYRAMFEGCKSLTDTPVINATTWTDNAGSSMFENCTSLKHTTITANSISGNYAYPFYSTFEGCTSLNKVTFNTTNNNVWTTSRFENWLLNVAPTGTFYCPEELNITENSPSGIPEGWTRIDF